MSKYDVEKDHPQTIKSEPDARPPEMDRPDRIDEKIDEAEEDAIEQLERRLREEDMAAIRRQTHSAHTIGSAIGGSRD